MNPRIEAELKLVRRHYNEVEYVEADGLHWFKVGPITAPDRWAPRQVLTVFYVTQGHPGTQPYGFFVPADLVFDGAAPSDTSAKYQPPFPGPWRFLSWEPENWRPTGDVETGSNLWGWVRGFVARLKEGK